MGLGGDKPVGREERMRPRGESSSRNGINAGLVQRIDVGGGRVERARYEGLEGKNTEVGWGIVHFYRDGEESEGLRLGQGGSREDVEFDAVNNGTQGEGTAGNREGEDQDCTVLCIPAVPSYLTPSDFLGFVGEKTREQVSHFRMVMTGRMNRYLVLMKFRDGGAAKLWRSEWDGKVFNSMEVNSSSCPPIYGEPNIWRIELTTSS